MLPFALLKPEWPISSFIAIGGSLLLVIIYLVSNHLNPNLDPSEPPRLKPRVPFIGHILGFLQHRVDYYSILGQKTNLPIATIPILKGKMYMLWDPSLMQAAMRHKSLSFDESTMEFTQRIFGLSERVMDIMRVKEDGTPSGWAKSIAGIKGAMMGPHLFRMNTRALNSVATTLNGIDHGAGLHVPDLYLWLQQLMTMATAEGLYGRENPLRKKPELVRNLWEMDENMQSLFFGVPQLAKTAIQNREAVQAGLVEFYTAKYDEKNDDVAEVLKVRARAERETGLTDEDVGRYEVSILFVSTTNTIPSLFWLFMYIWSKPEIIQDLREEAFPLVKLSDDPIGDMKQVPKEALVDITQLEEKCPLLVSCYREVIRLANQITGVRYVVEDTFLTDENGGGRSYLLKAGSFVTWSAKQMHRDEATWGNANAFDPRRFVPRKEEATDIDKKRKQAYTPFGGGKHLCPGRNFALAENLGFTLAMVLGFDIIGLDGNVTIMPTPKIGEALPKPNKGSECKAVTVRRREGWEDVNWRFIC